MAKIKLGKFQRQATDDFAVNNIQEWLEKLNRIITGGPTLIQGYSVSALPDATAWGSSGDFSSLIYVYDETGGATMAFSDGTNWRRVQDRAIVS